MPRKPQLIAASSCVGSSLVVERHAWRLQAYCLMATHLHLILCTPRPTLSAGMARLCSRFAQWFNWRYDRSGHVFAHRFSSQHITDEEHLFAAHRYVALKPVTAGLCFDPAGWKWGSYRALAGLEPPADFLDTAGVYDLFSVRPADARQGIPRTRAIPARKSGV